MELNLTQGRDDLNDTFCNIIGAAFIKNGFGLCENIAHDNGFLFELNANYAADCLISRALDRLMGKQPDAAETAELADQITRELLPKLFERKASSQDAPAAFLEARTAYQNRMTDEDQKAAIEAAANVVRPIIESSIAEIDQFVDAKKAQGEGKSMAAKYASRDGGTERQPTL